MKCNIYVRNEDCTVVYRCRVCMFSWYMCGFSGYSNFLPQCYMLHRFINPFKFFQDVIEWSFNRLVTWSW